MYQPKTGNKCFCRKGIERDNCPSCEGTGLQIDFKKIRERVFTCPETEDLTGTCHLCGKGLSYHDSDYKCLSEVKQS